MKTSRRAHRMQRHYRRMHRPGGLNLVSLMDIFTILVFFLMVNSSDVKVMQNTADVPLPLSSAQQEAEDTLTVRLSGQSVLVHGREVARLDTIEAEDATVPGLADALAWRREHQGAVPEQGLEVTIMAGRDTSYRLLRKIMQTCVDQQYRRVRLAVESSGEARNG
ncbi:biopolymer transporter ExbD [Marinobacter sp. NP-4(2019)]|uniref:ExbD/TolR family protein n=1 Tax=Marinobacter sp. NP-4(2019) TaxID=2488665 RepID=UPI000FC3CD15|nr:biopolymer transporter ExbD [Marinobacter sp. NP-4(2019)]AZT84070.1 biopolymer transporter ExbD [Marinobacter sp. NP-4(2019)]